MSLVAWGRAVKARRPGLPPLWLFTDPARTPDLLAALRALPRGLCGVVFRHDGVPGRTALLRQAARICRERRLLLVAAGRSRDVPAGVGRHLRGGAGPAGPRPSFVTSSAHNRADLVRARRAGARLAFLSPVFPTASHPGARPLGPARWGKAARCTGLCVAALGGVGGSEIRRLPRWTAGVGAIGALLP